MWDTLFNTDFWFTLINRAVRITAIIGITLITLQLSRMFVQRFVISHKGIKSLYMEEKRARTLISLLSSVIRYALYFIAAIMILQEFRIDTTSIVAGAGIIGLALGVGAQNLIKDFITGFFIILEDQYAVGDYIVSGEMAGIVEDIGFRITKLRDGNGVLHVIPNGSISRISNHTRGHTQAVINVPVPYGVSIDTVLAGVGKICQEVYEAMPEVLEIPSVLGIVDMKPDELYIKVIAKTIPLEQGKVETALRYKIKLMFEQANIDLPIRKRFSNG